MPIGISTPWRLLKCAAKNWSEDQATTIGAALAFYCAFSLVPLLVIIVAATGFFVGAELAYGHVEAQLRSLFGSSTAEILLEAMKSSQRGEGVMATVVSGVTLLIGATTVFAALEAALEMIWGSRAMVPKGWRGFVRSRLLSFGLILTVGFLLLVSLSISAGMTHLRDAITDRFTGLVALTSVIDFVLSVGMTIGLFALIYRYMPVKRLPWKPVLWGATFTALLFYIGRWATGLYLAKSTQPSAFGAAASFVALLLWLYYTAQIFLLGAEFTACIGGLRDENAQQKRVLKSSATSRTQ